MVGGCVVWSRGVVTTKQPARRVLEARSAHCGARAATTDATSTPLALECGAYVSNQLRNLNFLFRSRGILAKFDSQLAEHVADYMGNRAWKDTRAACVFGNGQQPPFAFPISSLRNPTGRWTSTARIYSSYIHYISKYL